MTSSDEPVLTSDTEIAKLKNAFRPLATDGAVKLAPKEKEVLQWIARGLTHARIAVKISMNEIEIDGHLAKIYDKLEPLGVERNQDAAVAYAIKRKWIIASHSLCLPDTSEVVRRERAIELTPRERDILELRSQGLRRAAIATELGLADAGSVDKSLTGIYDKFARLGVPRKIRAVLAYAIKHGLISCPPGWTPPGF